VTTPDATPRIAVGIPCFNEAPAIAAVIERWREALPIAEIVVFDNNSSDGTGAIARDAGARVIEVPDQGKGYAVRALFSELADRDAVVMVDGDGTYPADFISILLAPVLDGEVDMTVGARRPLANSGAMSPVRLVGNLLIRASFRVLIGPGSGDLLSGYRVFGPRFLAAVRPRSKGFEIEVELASEAISKQMRVREFVVTYHPRMEGTASKLKAFRDGCRILRTIVAQSLRYRPWRLLLIAALLSAAIPPMLDVRIVGVTLAVGLVAVLLQRVLRSRS